MPAGVLGGSGVEVGLQGTPERSWITLPPSRQGREGSREEQHSWLRRHATACASVAPVALFHGYLGVGSQLEHLGGMRLYAIQQHTVHLQDRAGGKCGALCVEGGACLGGAAGREGNSAAGTSMLPSHAQTSSTGRQGNRQGAHRSAGSRPELV